MTPEALLSCRWLLEHLPAAHTGQQGLGFHWRQFWNNHWSQYKKNPKFKSHPLWNLAGNERYNKAGIYLYGTLSNRLHEYGNQMGDKLDPDAQTVIDAIRPVNYDACGNIDLQAERKRWSG
jgi:hypothetical protein